MSCGSVVYSPLTSKTGLPGTKLAWPLGNAPSLPWFVYVREKGGEVFADNDNYHLLPRYRVELYLSEEDPELVKKFEKAVSMLGTYKHRESWLSDENCQMHSYTFTLTEEGA